MADQNDGDPQGGAAEGQEPDPKADRPAGQQQNDDDGWDGEFDEERARRTIKAQREEIKELRRAARQQGKVDQAKRTPEGKPADQVDPDKIRREVEEQVRAEAARDVAAARLEALAGKVLADPTDASRFIDVEDILDRDGKVDPDAARAELKALLEKRPYLAAEQKAKPAPLNGGGGQAGSGWSLDDEIRRQAGVK